VLGPGDRVPDIFVWRAPREAPVRLRELLAGGQALLAFYLFDWSPTWNGEAARGFGVAVSPLEMADVSRRSAFLIDGGDTVRAAWAYAGSELPDVDAILAAARAS